MVLIGVTIIEPVSQNFPWIESFAPMIIITGFFTFLVSVALFLYGLISNLKR